MDQKYMAYTSAVAHGKRARKVEKLRKQVLESIESTRYKLIDLPYYKGDNSLRQIHLDYIDFCYKIFNDDYAKIVNTEEIAEQSFDEMQAFILLQEKIDEKLKQANEKVNKGNKDFAAKYKVNLIDGGKDDLGEKMEQASKVSKYYNQIFLIFFKCNWQDNSLTKALNEKKVNDAEQARTSVIKYANEGLLALEKIPAFGGDGSVKLACKQALQGFKAIAENEVLKMTDFILKNENFEKIKKSFDAKSQDERTKEDVDGFNKAVKEINAAVNVSNQAGANAGNKRNDLYKNWEEAVAAFYDTHTPHYR
ncbi:unnamed protein product [Rotaria sp. Silwood1]|nr:unnamed protein product [Rotaria sp. Silwood1]CAF4791290.1 unnamed protein product [Rotaria sp. Silwood1]